MTQALRHWVGSRAGTALAITTGRGAVHALLYGLAMPGRFDNEVVIVTGGGIGRAAAVRFASEGASVVPGGVYPVDGGSVAW